VQSTCQEREKEREGEREPEGERESERDRERERPCKLLKMEREPRDVMKRQSEVEVPPSVPRSACAFFETFVCDAFCWSSKLVVVF